ncbi:hypothetical protein [Pseudooceanicola sp. LIPI14-2-Ac024]|uniref:hypothetical protein n=1 Tax=Pseudooceanicola sp. LIPI14-2-Ac024 TaxID=3344875 RepID=UPI0035D0D86F
MANASTVSSASGFRARFDNFLTGLGQGFNAYVESRSRVHQIHKLNALSDAELAKRGIKREEIPSYVFRDLFYV